MSEIEKQNEKNETMTSDPKLGVSQQKVLKYLRKHDGAHSVEAIAKALRVTKATVKGALLRLFAHGLVMRTAQVRHNLWSVTPPAIVMAGEPPTHTPPLHGDVPTA